MKSLYYWAAAAAILLGAFSAQAQGAQELLRFQRAAGDRSILFRGKQAPRYSFLANGHPYWDTQEFQNGDIVCEGNLYRNVPINFDAVQQYVLVRLSSSPLSVALKPEQVSSVTLGDRHFVSATPDGDLPEGFYEVFGDGPFHVFKQNVKVPSSSIDSVNGEQIGYYDENYRNDVTRFFALHTYYYYVDADGHATRFKRRSHLIRQFPDRKREIRKALRTAVRDSSPLDFDSYCRLVLKIAAQQ